jgi:hypothetical protein
MKQTKHKKITANYKNKNKDKRRMEKIRSCNLELRKPWQKKTFLGSESLHQYDKKLGCDLLRFLS